MVIFLFGLTLVYDYTKCIYLQIIANVQDSMREVSDIGLKIGKNQAWDGEQRELAFMSVVLSLSKSKDSSF